MSQFLHNPALILTDSIKQPNLQLSIWPYRLHPSFVLSLPSLFSCPPPSTSWLLTKSSFIRLCLILLLLFHPLSCWFSTGFYLFYSDAPVASFCQNSLTARLPSQLPELMETWTKTLKEHQWFWFKVMSLMRYVLKTHLLFGSLRYFSTIVKKLLSYRS